MWCLVVTTGGNVAVLLIIRIVELDFLPLVSQALLQAL
jgi:hypothetical protein